ncbi:complex I subunit 5 family protein [Erythrobacter sp. AP23]|uniref:complex I subunit 5 family protein n=1 Tax=Erythrobacter sp. AP23 TaxID=499656 RepID=UPI0018DB430E|nr:proton-conducting transporter membrane subunit [Erythrobacter sp. AP23]
MAGDVVQFGTLSVAIGGWAAPLGIVLRADGLAATMIAMTALVGLAVTVQAALATKKQAAKQAASFWPLWLMLWSGLNTLFLSTDLFNLFVMLEIIGLAAAGLAALSGKRAALEAALRYLLLGLFASLLYLFGVALLYVAYGTLEIGQLARMIGGEPAALIAMALMFAGLAFKAALFPLHGWLPPAHGNAPGAASAILSALVVKGAFYLMLRLWIDLYGPGGVAGDAAAIVLGIAGAGAILWGGRQALRAERLKLLVAYSTVAQIGYLFLAFPLLADAGSAAWRAALYLALAHALAKAGLFLACDRVISMQGNDRIDFLSSTQPGARIIQLTIALAAVSLIGLPPSGGFIGKWLLIEAAFQGSNRIWVTVVVVCGTLLSAAAMFRLLARFFTSSETTPNSRPQAVATRSDLVPFVLVVAAIALGFAAPPLLALMQVGAAA